MAEAAVLEAVTTEAAVNSWALDKAHAIAGNLVKRGVHPAVASVLVGTAAAPGPIIQALLDLFTKLLPTLLACIVPAAATPTPAEVQAMLHKVAQPILGLGMRWQLSQELHHAIRDREIEDVALLPLRAEIVAQCKAATEADGTAILAA